MNKALTIDWADWVIKIHHQWAVPCGWWTNVETGEPLDRNWSEACLLVVSEIIEAMEGLRKGLMDDKLPHRKMVEVELADVVIRLCDMAGGFGFQLFDTTAESHLLNMKYDFDRNVQTEWLMKLVGFTNTLHQCGQGLRRDVCTGLIFHIFEYGERFGYSVYYAMVEKHEFNKNRADHKLENRKAGNGKKF